MNGAERIIQTAIACGIDVCFANPGTTEMPLVAALDSVPGIRAVLGTFEGVCTGAADGYGRVTGRPAMTLLHLGPGFANGIANLHNAKRAHTPIVNIIGEHASWHLGADPPLHSDIESLAAPVSHWLRRSTSAETLASDVAEAVAAACTPPGHIATLIVPNDFMLQTAASDAQPLPVPAATPVTDDDVARAAALLADGEATMLLLGGHALHEAGLQQAGRIAAVTGCALICETFPARMARGAGIPAPSRFPYFPEQGLELLAKFKRVIYAGARPPVTFFGYDGVPSHLVSDAHQTVMLAAPGDDVVDALTRLASAVNATDASQVADSSPPEMPTGKLDGDKLCRVIAALQPEGAFIMDEGVTSTLNYLDIAAGAPPYTYMRITGGAIGMGIPASTGAAIAADGRPVINIQADGSGLYTLQGLWTQARENLNVTTVLCNNRSYRILQFELMRAGITPGDAARALSNLAEPAPDWVQLARGFGVAAARAEDAESLAHELERALNEDGPHLIEAML